MKRMYTYNVQDYVDVFGGQTAGCVGVDLDGDLVWAANGDLVWAYGAVVTGWKELTTYMARMERSAVLYAPDALALDSFRYRNGEK